MTIYLLRLWSNSSIVLTVRNFILLSGWHQFYAKASRRSRTHIHTYFHSQAHRTSVTVQSVIIESFECVGVSKLGSFSVLSNESVTQADCV